MPANGMISTMTERERYLATLQFEKPDKVPFHPGGPRKSTIETWQTQGLPKDKPWFETLCRELGLRMEKTKPKVQPGVDFRMRPQFEEKVLEHKDGHLLIQDWMGNIVEISDEFDATYLRNAIDFVTRKWHKFPVENRADFEEMKKRYDPRAPGRFPDDFNERCKEMRRRDYAVTVRVSGPFWQLREWCGFEPLCMFFLDDPDFIREMCAFWTEFVSQTMAPILEAGVVDCFYISEDMAYKEKPMISPEMTREFLLPSYVRWSAEARQAGVPLIDMDSDGRVDLLIPVWLEGGINVCDPIEVAAGNDIIAFRKQFGRKIAFRQGVDKRCMAKGGKVIEAELARLEPLIKDGGFIPGCDHGVPFDVSWPNFIHYSRLLAKMTGWL